MVTGIAVVLSVIAGVGTAVRLHGRTAASMVAIEGQWVTATQPLLIAPSPDARAIEGASVSKGAQVVIQTPEVDAGAFVLVEDSSGRRGYVSKADLTQTPMLEVCVRAPGELTKDSCLSRATSARKACVSKCPESRLSVCAEICGEQYGTCIETCNRFAATQAKR